MYRGDIIDRFLLLAVLLLAFALRVVWLAEANIWWDEGWTVLLMRKSVGSIVEMTSMDTHPPFYFWLSHGIWLLIGESEFAVRFLSVAVGTLLEEDMRLAGWEQALNKVQAGDVLHAAAYIKANNQGGSVQLWLADFPNQRTSASYAPNAKLMRVPLRLPIPPEAHNQSTSLMLNIAGTELILPGDKANSSSIPTTSPSQRSHKAPTRSLLAFTTAQQVLAWHL